MKYIKLFEDIDFDDIDYEEDIIVEPLVDKMKNYPSGYYVIKVYTDIDFDIFYEGINETDFRHHYSSKNKNIKKLDYFYLGFHWRKQNNRISDGGWMNKTYKYGSKILDGYEYYLRDREEYDNNYKYLGNI